MRNASIIILELAIFLFSAIVHEVAHGLVAFRLGDPTAKEAGRLTLNPLKHLDPVGSFLIPVTLFIVGSPVLFGWAKPVPYNPYNLKNPKRDAGLIALAGSVSNFSLALIFAILLKLAALAGFTSDPILISFNLIILVNIALGIFNLVPIPPLDGSKVLFSILPNSAIPLERELERYGFFILMVFIFLGFSLISPLIAGLYHLLGGSLI